jgi:hypothetical protein
MLSTVKQESRPRLQSAFPVGQAIFQILHNVKFAKQYVSKRDLRLYLQTLAHEYLPFSWTALVCGHFFDWSLDFMHMWVKTRTVDYLDGET